MKRRKSPKDIFHAEEHLISVEAAAAEIMFHVSMARAILKKILDYEGGAKRKSDKH